MSIENIIIYALLVFFGINCICAEYKNFSDPFIPVQQIPSSKKEAFQNIEVIPHLLKKLIRWRLVLFSAITVLLLLYIFLHKRFPSGKECLFHVLLFGGVTYFVSIFYNEFVADEVERILRVNVKKLGMKNTKNFKI